MLASHKAQNLYGLPHILVVDDDERIRTLLTRYLEQNGFLVCVASDAKAAREMLSRFQFDAMVLDIMMPGETGLDLTLDLRKTKDIPILLLTALGEVDDRITGLQTGADDYLPKPFEPQELVLRLQALLRRRKLPEASASAFKLGRWEYDVLHSELKCGDELVKLTTVENTLLQALTGRAGEAVSREELAEICELDGGERTIDVQVTRLRRKLEDDPKQPRVLQTIRGKGYLLRGEIL
ncbi:MAG: response regulator [Pseudomonadota bacterium]|nr:response regulator [Pseudomonadota bacterium]